MNTQTGIVSRIGNFLSKFMILVEEPDVESPDTVSGMAESLVQSQSSDTKLSKDEIENILNEGLKAPEIREPKKQRVNKYSKQIENTLPVGQREYDHEHEITDDDRDI